MTTLDYAKQYHSFDVFLVLLDDAGYTDEEIMTKFEVPKQRIYDARKRVEPILEALKQVDPYKRDLRNKDVQSIIEAFMTAFGTTKASEYDRYAAKRLHVKHGTENMIKVINSLAAHAGEQYCPSINSVTELENKLPSIIAYLKKQSGSMVVIND